MHVTTVVLFSAVKSPLETTKMQQRWSWVGHGLSRLLYSTSLYSKVFGECDLSQGQDLMRGSFKRGFTVLVSMLKQLVYVFIQHHLMESHCVILQRSTIWPWWSHDCDWALERTLCGGESNLDYRYVAAPGIYQVTSTVIMLRINHQNFENNFTQCRCMYNDILMLQWNWLVTGNVF